MDPIRIDCTPPGLVGDCNSAEQANKLPSSDDKMPSIARQQPWPRGPWNELHHATFDGSTERLVALLSDGSLDIDQGNPVGSTPLWIASFHGHPHAVRILLNNGANVSIESDGGFTALHGSAGRGFLAVSKMLVEAGADLEAATTDGSTPLHVAAEAGHLEVISVLIEAGANPDSRCLDGATPLFMAAQEGHMDAVKVLLRAKANPLLTCTDPGRGTIFVPLDMAARNGHSKVVRELVQQVGIEGCGGATGGVEALGLAAVNQHLDTIAVLADARVVDTGVCLVTAAAYGCELPVKVLLQQRKDGEAAYVNCWDRFGGTPLVHAIGLLGLSSPSPRIVRLLIDAGADTTFPVRVTNTEGGVRFHGTPLALATRMLREKKIAEKDATEEQLHRLEGIRCLLLRVEAVHAVSFLWPVDIPSMIATTAEVTSRKVAASTPLRMMLPILRRRARRPRVLLAALFRSSGKL